MTCKNLTPLAHAAGASPSRFITNDEGILINIHSEELEYYLYEGKKPPYFELAGPREKIYYDPSKLRCALVTCGGLCPGLNDTIRSIVLELYHFCPQPATRRNPFDLPAPSIERCLTPCAIPFALCLLPLFPATRHCARR